MELNGKATSYLDVNLNEEKHLVAIKGRLNNIKNL